MVKVNVCIVAVLAAVCTTCDAGAPAKVVANPAVQVALPVPVAGAPPPPATPAPPPPPAPTAPASPPTKNPAIQVAVPDDKPGTVRPPTQAGAPPAAPGLPNWVGPLVGKPKDSACYRKSYMTTKKQCAAGYNFDKALTCWTQCPIEYPVECGMECIPQNQDCTKEILKKVTSVVNVALNAATSGVFGSLTKAAKGVQVGVRCGQELFTVVNKIAAMAEEVEGGAAGTTKDQVLFAINKSDFVVYDLPAAVATCIGVPVPQGLNKAKDVTGKVQQLVEMAVNVKSSGINLKDFTSFLGATKAVVPAATTSIESLSAAENKSLLSKVTSGATCGMDLNSVINKITGMVQTLKTENPANPMDVIKMAVLNSDVVMKDLPKAATSCATATKTFASREAASTGFPSRDGIIKTVHVMIDGIVGATSKDDKPVSNADFALSVADMGLNAIAMIDPTGIAEMAAEFVQPICGPTAYVGDIDSGAADQALGLNTIQKAFSGSAGTWAKAGDGQLRVTFKSVDDKDVTVNVLSGGQKKYEIKVKKGETVEWSKPLAEFQGKTLYLDRWRAGLLGIAGTGGGSLLVWIPNNKDGALTLTVPVNPTSTKDKDRRMRH